MDAGSPRFRAEPWWIKPFSGSYLVLYMPDFLTERGQPSISDTQKHARASVSDKLAQSNIFNLKKTVYNSSH